MGIFSQDKNKKVVDVDWSPHGLPKNADETQSRCTMESAMLEREPSRMDDYFQFTYLQMLPECKDIEKETLIASGPSTLFFSDESRPATAFLTDKRIVHLNLYEGLNIALGGYHEKLIAAEDMGNFVVGINWDDMKCPVLGFGPRFGKDGKQNRYALEWWYSYSKIGKDHFA
ncbi:MAG: hypothetical protein O3C26_04260 [Actinomycetota bacterium]|nr:hypothetical protein [Actinomycetota bacterium]